MRQQDPPLAPNHSPFPSSIVNNPEFSPFLAHPGRPQISFDEVPELTALASGDGSTEYTPQGPYSNLIALRMQFPHLEVVPWPPRAKSIALTANVAQDLNLPDGTVAVIMRGNNDYYVSNAGNADIPTATNDSQSVYKPEGYMLYTGNIRSLSIIAPNGGTIVTILCYMLTAVNPR